MRIKTLNNIFIALGLIIITFFSVYFLNLLSNYERIEHQNNQIKQVSLKIDDLFILTNEVLIHDNSNTIKKWQEHNIKIQKSIKLLSTQVTKVYLPYIKKLSRLNIEIKYIFEDYENLKNSSSSEKYSKYLKIQESNLFSIASRMNKISLELSNKNIFEIKTIISSLKKNLILFGLILIFFSIIVYFLVYFKIIKPHIEIAKQLINKDNLSTISWKKDDEIGDFIKAFNNLFYKNILSEKKYKQTFDLAGLGIARVGLDGKWLEVNSKMCKIVKYSNNELMKLSFQDITYKDDLDIDLKYVEQMINKEIDYYEMDKRYITKYNEIVWIKLSVTLVLKQNGDPDYFISIIEDIDEKKKLSIKLKESNENLEQFAYLASHDLQEPLRMVSSYLQLIERRYKDKLDQSGIDFINYAVDGSKRMQLLINGLLQFSRVQTKEQKFETFDMNEMIKEVLENLSLVIKEKNAEVNIMNNLPTMYIDKKQIIQLFQNLISNSLKYCDKIPLIEISSEEKEREYLFKIKDNGIGMDTKYHDKVFQIFQRLHDKESYSGTGLGLALAKRIVQRYNGKIWFESEIDKGTIFYLILEKKSFNE